MSECGWVWVSGERVRCGEGWNGGRVVLGWDDGMGSNESCGD